MGEKMRATLPLLPPAKVEATTRAPAPTMRLHSSGRSGRWSTESASGMVSVNRSPAGVKKRGSLSPSTPPPAATLLAAAAPVVADPAGLLLPPTAEPGRDGGPLPGRDADANMPPPPPPPQPPLPYPLPCPPPLPPPPPPSPLPMPAGVMVAGAASSPSCRGDALPSAAVVGTSSGALADARIANARALSVGAAAAASAAARAAAACCPAASARAAA